MNLLLGHSGMVMDGMRQRESGEVKEATGGINNPLSHIVTLGDARGREGKKTKGGGERGRGGRRGNGGGKNAEHLLA